MIVCHINIVNEKALSKTTKSKFLAHYGLHLKCYEANT